VKRAIFAASGVLLIAVAFLAAVRVADTREGLIAEIVTLLAGLAGVALLLYGLVPKRPGPASPAAPPPRAPMNEPRPRTANDLLIGGGGIAIALVLLGGLGLSGGWAWAALGAVLLVPMIAGSAYLVIAFFRAPERDWSIDLRRLFASRSGG
jgi:hypothetical protein